MRVNGVTLKIFKTTRKVQLFGSSLALTIPAMFAKINDIEKGKRLNLFYDLNGTLILANCENEEELTKCLINLLESLKINLSKRRIS